MVGVDGGEEVARLRLDARPRDLEGLRRAEGVVLLLEGEHGLLESLGLRRDGARLGRAEDARVERVDAGRVHEALVVDVVHDAAEVGEGRQRRHVVDEEPRQRAQGGGAAGGEGAVASGGQGR